MAIGLLAHLVAPRSETAHERVYRLSKAAGESDSTAREAAANYEAVRRALDAE